MTCLGYLWIVFCAALLAAFLVADEVSHRREVRKGEEARRNGRMSCLR